MQEMTLNEIDEVSGALGMKEVIWVADQVTDFFKGFAAGWNDAQAAK